MIKIRIVAVGKMRDKWLQAGLAEYRKRISRFADLEIIEVADSPDNDSAAVAMRAEGERLLAKIGTSDTVLALDLHGKEMDSEAFAAWFQSWVERSGGRLTFIIAGSQGYDAPVIDRASDRICLSKLTFPHQMARLILTEQLYRAFKITAGETYHK